MKKRKIPMRKCILSNEMKPKKEMIRVVQNKEGNIAADATGKMQGRGAYVSKDVALVEQAQEAQKLEQFFKASQETLEPVYKEIIRLIYREEIPSK
ncbi:MULTISPECIES: YlxR family protein [unclassified Staphylococcus]|uniref:RNase P modulator RnpM n=1 Tax=unclassified Staphylococcus TaxID=91994 RepID=UPI0021D233D4|nr:MULTISPECIES: YlxR family protein [unclassified Staphylococcus]UXR70406.1 YlxR family protein [Staphylococcus sp. IVB6246]UXR72473.1 YlxR family protein [Staphylococcus sp. IVB6240]UXR74776.1 YlxR family protein [Staphylococcus sp. IVB6238]UXR77110.1 YlxR family protein [Staphylococcus sp. IVB6233]UXR81235.1 YlxR family protein [Staphylococcus sp. IVB6218]